LAVVSLICNWWERNSEPAWLADNNRIRLIPKQPERGYFFDRQGKIRRLSRAVYVMASRSPKQSGLLPGNAPLANIAFPNPVQSDWNKLDL